MELLKTRVTGYDRVLQELRTLNIELSQQVDELVRKALGTLEGIEGLSDWRAADNKIDRVRDEVVNRSFAIMSLQQLTPKDLRWILGHQRIAQELERIADYACDIAELNALNAADAWPQAILDMARELKQMLEYVESVLREDKVVDRDLNDHDDLIDDAYAHIQQALLAKSQSRGNAVNSGGAGTGRDAETAEKADDQENDGNADLAFSLVVARTLERMGDHIVNVAEMLVYIQTGQRRLNL